MEKTYVWLAGRVVLGWIFLWAFLDKMWGLGFGTKSGHGWIDGVSPAAGFLKFGVSDFLGDFFHALSGNVWVDWLFMGGLLGIGIALLLGIALRIATIAGIIMMALMFLAIFPSPHNPLIDEHVMYAIFLWGIYSHREQCGASWWRKLNIVSTYKILE